MRRLPFFLQNLLILLLATILPAWAIYQGTTTFSGLSVTNNAAVGGNLTVTGTTTQTGAVTFTAKPTLSTGTIGANSDTYTIPDVGDASFVMTAGAQTIAGVKTLSSIPILPLGGETFTGTTYNTTLKALNAMGQACTVTIPDPGAATANVVLDAGNSTIGGTKTFSTPPTITGGLTSANIASGSAKRIIQRVLLSPVTGAAADSTTYAGIAAFNRAGTIKKIGFVCAVAPTAGTDTLEALKNGTTTTLSTATVDANGLTAFTVADQTLTATGADLALVATDCVRFKYNAGSQTVDAEDVEAIIEFEPTDF